MVAWTPITKEALLERIAQGEGRMLPAERRLWTTMKIEPVKWRQDPYGTQGGGFWVVGLIGSSVIWYNDVEDGFNRSTYLEHGEIQDYWCNQDELDTAVKYLLNAMDHGADLVGMRVPQIRWGRAEP